FEVLGMKKLFTGYDYTLIVAPILLSLFGIMMIYSASMVSTTIDGLEDTYYLFKQLSWFVLGLIGFLFCSIFPYRHYQRFIVRSEEHTSELQSRFDIVCCLLL